MTDTQPQPLSAAAQKFQEAALKKQKENQHSLLGTHHWLSVLMDRYPTLIESLVRGLKIFETRKQIADKMKQGDPGAALDGETVEKRALEYASARGQDQPSDRDVAAAILISAGYSLNQPTAESQPPAAPPQTAPAQPAEVQSGAAEPNQPALKTLTTPMLNQFGRDLTEEAKTGKLSALLGREAEIQLTIETLCRRTKRNPILVGPAGVGKTAIVEGLAQRIAAGDVPAMLQDHRIIALQPSVLVAGSSMHGQLEQRIKEILQEARHPGILLFIDEIHSIMGAGGMLGTSDLASILKPALARGDLACIAATTDDEYRRFIETDAALERRFQPIRINELTPAQTLPIMQSLAEDLSRHYNLKVDPRVLPWLVDFADRYLRNRHFPDKAVDLLEQCFAHAATLSQTEITEAGAKEVAQRLIGMPLALDQRMGNLTAALDKLNLFNKEDRAALINRLQVTLRGLDLRNTRPNIVVLLGGDAARQSDLLAETLAEHLFGDPDRVITIDLSRMLHPEDVNLLVGAPPGYVGYSDSLPLHRLLQSPWSVVRFENVEACHPYIREVLAQALADGWIFDGRGKPIYFSDSVILLTAEIAAQSRRQAGFMGAAGAEEPLYLEQFLTSALGDAMAAQVDLFALGLPSANTSPQDWIQETIFSRLEQRYLSLGIRLRWSPSALAWLSEQAQQTLSQHSWEEWADRVLTPSVLQVLNSQPQPPAELEVQVIEGKLHIQPVPTEAPPTP